MAGAAIMVMFKAALAVLPTLSVTIKVKAAEFTAALGVPDNTPAELKDKPAGKVPAVLVQL